jgi:translation initiation factor 2B subunit (eIF-2B alpha/beta/delta family)
MIDEAYINQMQLIRSNIDLEETSSATQSYNTVLDTLERFTNGDLNNSFNLVESYTENIKKVVAYRPCHTLIRKLSSELSKILDNKLHPQQKKLALINQLIQNNKKERENINNKIKNNSKPFLSDGKSILIYGYSTMVIQALESIEEDLRKDTIIYISECRGKTQFNLINEMIYNDGLQYAKKCSLMGFKKLYFIPDISIANLMKRGFIGKVLFGANGIDEKTNNFGHTCGHLMVADLSFIYNIPLYVISDSSKIGELGYDDETNRDINWLPKTKGYSKIYENIELLNPREDTVGPDRISLIITENGIMYPRKHKMLGQFKILYSPENSSIQG